MAIWALVLSFLWCMPIALIVSIGLAITVLVQSRGGIQNGRGKAVAALIIAGLGVIVLVACVVAAALGAFDDVHRDAQGRVTTSGSVPSNSLRVGDCYDQPPPRGREIHVSTVTVVPCEQAHQWEVFHSFELSDGPFPGDENVARFAEGGCIDAYPAFDGCPTTTAGST